MLEYARQSVAQLLICQAATISRLDFNRPGTSRRTLVDFIVLDCSDEEDLLDSIERTTTGSTFTVNKDVANNSNIEPQN